MTIAKQLGMRITYLRKQKGWTQEELAFQANIHKNYLCDLENGKRNPTLMILSLIADALEIDLAFLFKGIQSFEE